MNVVQVCVDVGSMCNNGVDAGVHADTVDTRTSTSRNRH